MFQRFVYLSPEYPINSLFDYNKTSQQLFVMPIYIGKISIKLDSSLNIEYICCPFHYNHGHTNTFKNIHQNINEI